MITVFYDGKCGLCSREIDHYRKVAPPGIFQWQDVTVDASALKARQVDLVEALRLLHALDAQGNLHVGVDAFLLIWRNLDRWRLLARIVALPGIRPLTDRLYRLFADWRFARLGHCQVALTERETASPIS